MKVSDCSRSCEEETAQRVRLRRGMAVLASADGNTVPEIARLVQGDEDAIRGVIHRFNETGVASLDSQWAGDRSRLISPEDEAFIVATATRAPKHSSSPSPAGACANSPPA
jgi:transposase